MLKKVLFVSVLVGVAAVLVGGRPLLAWIHNHVDRIQQQIADNTPIDRQLQDVRDELKQLDPEIYDMMRQIAKEEMEVQKLEREVSNQRSSLDTSYTHIMVLRNHLDLGETYFVHNGKSYSNDQVRQDLTRRFNNHKTQEATLNSLERILEARIAALDAARQQLEETLALKRELEVDIENLEVEARLLEVAKTTSDLNFDDNTRISRIKDRMADIESRISVERTVLNVQETSSDGIPLDREAPVELDDITGEIDSYFGGSSREFASIEN